MTADSAQREPTMEEILASIRRIISEDDKPAEAGADVLELKPAEPEPAPKPQPAPPPAAKAAPPPKPAEPPPPAPEPIIEAEPEPEFEPEPEVVAEADEEDIMIMEKEPEAAPEPQPRPAAPAPRPVMEEGLVAEPAATQAAGALGKLMGSMMVQSGVTLDDVVKQMLKPLLKDWLDANLPQLVEIEVQKEIERIRRMAR
ncbi:MAG: DUF2497 domain-containing protein [Alphaproteobacteria bacterium]|nr:DUF2497 domain-containing protein [Alphaproteobacteria bacterium]